jgi:replicative DNA helicase
MTNDNCINKLVDKFQELFCPENSPLTGGEQMKTGNSYPNADVIDLVEHVTGKTTYAIDLVYIDHNGQKVCKTGVLDIDELTDESLENVNQIRDYLQTKNIASFTSLSGNKGYHSYIVSEPVPEAVMTKALRKIKALFPFKGEIIPGDNGRCKIAPCLHQVAEQWSYLFENKPSDPPFTTDNLPDDFHEQQLRILEKITPTPAGVLVAFAMEEADHAEKVRREKDMVPDLDKRGEKHVQCIIKLVTRGGSSAIGTMDKNILTLANYCSSANIDAKTAFALAKTMAEASETGPVDSKKTTKEKILHFKSIQKSPSVTDKPFSCAYMLRAKKELKFDCGACPARPKAIRAKSPEDPENNDKSSKFLLEEPLADLLLGEFIHNGMPKEKISPWIFPGEDYLTYYRDKDGNRTPVTFRSRTIKFKAMTEGVTTPTQLADWLDKDKFSKNPFKEYCEDVGYNILKSWEEAKRTPSQIKMLNELKNKTVTNFSILKKRPDEDPIEVQRALARAVELTQKYEISEQIKLYDNELCLCNKDVFTLNAEFTHNAGNILEDSQKNAVVPLTSHAQELIESISGNENKTIPTPFTTLNKLLGGGFKPGKKYTIVTQPGGGKTTFAAQCADFAAESEIPAIFISMEMGRDQLFAYSIARHGNINSAKIETANPEIRKQIEPKLVENIQHYFETTGRYLFCIEGKYDTSPAIIEIAISIVRAHMGLERTDPVLVVIDYLQLLSTGNDILDHGQNETHKISELAVKVKQLARDCNVAVLAISDVTKKEQEGTWSNKELSLNSPRGSNRIAHASDCVLALYSEPAQNQGGKADTDPWDVLITKFKDDNNSREFVERLVEKKETTELGGDGATVFSRLEIIKNRGGQGRGNQIMLYHRAYHKFEPVEIEGHAQAERRA